MMTRFLLHNLILPAEEETGYIGVRGQRRLNYRLVKQYTENEGVTEQLKATDQMKWVQKMNNINNRAMEIVNNELIYV